MNIIITGAGKGIGLELLRLFSAETRNTVIGISRDVYMLKKLAVKRENIKVITFDLTETDRFLLLRKAIVKLVDNVDILINNAGALVNKPYNRLNRDDFDKMFNVNVKAPFFLINSITDLFAKNAHIVNIGSMAGFQGSSKFAGLSLYSASKAALGCMSECLATELKDREIRVNCLALGAVHTEMFSAAFPGHKAPLDASEMAAFIAGFAVSSGKYINGKVIPVAFDTP